MIDSTYVVQDIEWAFSMQCSYNPSIHDHAYMAKFVDHVWYFDSGATKNITLHKNFFTSLEDDPNGNTITCANNAPSLIKWFGTFVIIATNDYFMTLSDDLNL